MNKVVGTCRYRCLSRTTVPRGETYTKASAKSSMAKSIALEDFQGVFGSLTELSSVALGASIVTCSDEFFAPASDLLKVAVRVYQSAVDYS